MGMRIVGIIPAHLASVRFPRKILHPFHGLPMVEHVRRRALLSAALAEVYVATCDDEIAETVRGFGGRIIMTSSDHRNGTSRVAEASRQLDCTHVMLLQGDEPLLLPRHIDRMASTMALCSDSEAWNATGPITQANELDRHSFVKCAVSPADQILYCFRRTPCFSAPEVQRSFIRKILGLIAYRSDFLQRLVALSPTPCEQAELIEQMRIIEHGHRIRSVAVDESVPSVNEPDEAEVVLRYLQESSEQQSLLARVVA